MDNLISGLIGIIGAIIGGAIGYFGTTKGVKINLDHNMKVAKYKLFTQLRLTYQAIINDQEGVMELYCNLGGGRPIYLLYDHSWYESLSILNLPIVEQKTIIEWFFCIQRIENLSRYIEKRNDNIGDILTSLINISDEIKEILEKNRC